MYLNAWSALGGKIGSCVLRMGVKVPEPTGPSCGPHLCLSPADLASAPVPGLPACHHAQNHDGPGLTL